MEQLLAEKIEGLLGGEEFERFAVVLVEVLLHFGAGRSGDRDENGSHGFFGGAAARTGDPGDRERVIRVGAASGTFSHFSGDRFADRAMLRESLPLNAEKRLLGVIAVSDEPGAENRGSTWNIRDAVGDVTAGARLGEGKSFLFFGEETNDDCIERFRFAPVNEATEMLARDFFRLAHQRFSGIATRDEAQIDFTDAGAVTDVEPTRDERRQIGRDALFKERFTDPDGAKDTAAEVRRRTKTFRDKREHLIQEHWAKLARRTRQHDEQAGFCRSNP